MPSRATLNFSGSRRGGILGGLLVTCLLLCVLAVVAGIYIARNVSVRTVLRDSGKDVSIDTPGGQIVVRARDKVDPGSLGVPIYPGATRAKDGGGATVEWTSRDGQEEKALAVSGAGLLTSDDAGKVLAWYRTQLPDWIIVTERDGATRLEHKEGGLKRIIAIRDKSDGTHIGVATVGEPASN